MPQASSRKSTTVVASREQSKKSICNQTILTTVSILSKEYGLLPCFCEYDPLRMMRNSSISSNARCVANKSHNNTEEQSSNESSRFISQDNSDDDKQSSMLEPTISSFTTEQQNINATNRTKKKTKTTKIKRKRTKRTTKKKKTRTSKSKRKRNERSPFPDPTIFHSMPKMQDSDDVTLDNIHENHLCCKPVSSVTGLSSNDQKKLIEHDYLTLISLLPIYLSSQGNFVDKIREQTNISHEGALELDRLMNEWSSTRLFIGANSHYKTLTQKI